MTEEEEDRCPRCGSTDVGWETSDALPGEEFRCCNDCTWSEL